MTTILLLIDLQLKDRSVDSATEPQLSFNNESFVGGNNVKASQNIIYGSLIPRYEIQTPSGIEGTGIDATMRTLQEQVLMVVKDHLLMKDRKYTT